MLSHAEGVILTSIYVTSVGIHFDDAGRTLLAQLLMNAIGETRQSMWDKKGGGGGGGGLSTTRRSRAMWRKRLLGWGGVTKTHRGYCAVTQGSNDCNNEQHIHGFWPAQKHGIADLASCAARCRTCTGCRFVSFSPAHDECAWYRICKRPLELQFQGDTYISAERGYT